MRPSVSHGSLNSTRPTQGSPTHLSPPPSPPPMSLEYPSRTLHVPTPPCNNHCYPRHTQFLHQSAMAPLALFSLPALPARATVVTRAAQVRQIPHSTILELHRAASI